MKTYKVWCKITVERIDSSKKGEGEYTDVFERDIFPTGEFDKLKGAKAHAENLENYNAVDLYPTLGKRK